MRKILLVLLLTLSVLPLRAQRNTGYAEDYVQYFPMALKLTIGTLGVPHENKFWDVVLGSALATAYNAACVNYLKLVVPEVRPNGTRHDSFPSGHTATAFCGAELVRLEFGWGWGAAAYASAFYVGYARMAHQCHYRWDVLTGAAIGVVSANLGYMSMQPVKDFFGWGKTDLAVLPSVDPVTGTYCATLSLTF